MTGAHSGAVPGRSASVKIGFDVLTRSIGAALIGVCFVACSGSTTANGPGPGAAVLPAASQAQSAATADGERSAGGPTVSFAAAITRAASASKQSAVAGTFYANAIISARPIAYYRLGDSGVTALDSSGNNHPGVVSAAGTGITQGAAGLLKGDGTTSTSFAGNPTGNITAARAAAFEPATTVSIELWDRPTTTNPIHFQSLAAYGDNAKTNFKGYGLKLDYHRNAFSFKLALPGGVVTLEPFSGPGFGPIVGQTYHVVGTYDGATAALYVNGVLSVSQSVTGNIVYDPSHLMGLIIGDNQAESGPVLGSLQEVAIYNTVLHAPDVAAHYALGSGSFPLPAPTTNPRLTLPAGFYADTIANIPGAKGLAAASNGDLLVGTNGSAIDVIPNADGLAAAGSVHTLITLTESPAQGVAIGPANTLYAGTSTTIWKIPYTPGDLFEPGATAIARVRTGPIAPNSDGDVHTTTSIAVNGSTVYAGVGSSCNACVEVDPTRATIMRMGLDGSGLIAFAHRIRNPMALAFNPATGGFWAGGAGQDNLAQGHPYEYFDAVTSHAAPIDYGWPVCEENQIAYTAGANCSATVIPRIELPAYSTLTGAAFYPTAQTGPYAFPSAYRGGVFISAHGSWHAINGIQVVPPHVVFVAMKGDTPATPVNWANPAQQWAEFFTGFQAASGARSGRTRGVAVGLNGSLFVADDDNGNIYRIRPGPRP
jgi:glucose/arabinose dehydrogenase